jgi:hypothetical protein
MYTPSVVRRAFMLFVCVPPAVLVLSAGAGCPIQPPGTEQFGLDLVNNTSFEVDPDVAVEDFLLDLGTLPPLEGTDQPAAFDVDCLPGDTLTVEPLLLLTQDTPVLTINGPVGLEEGVDYVCGDIIRLEFSQDEGEAFFTEVFINNVQITPPGVVGAEVFGLDLVNDTTSRVDPGVHVGEFLLGLGTLTALEGSNVPVGFNLSCFEGDTLSVDPILLLGPDTGVPAANGPVGLEEGIDYACGDTIRLEFSQDVTETFFVDVFVNDVLVNP